MTYPSEGVGELGASRRAARRHHVGNQDGVASVICFREVVLKRAAAGAETDDPALLAIIGIALGVDGVLDDACPSGARRIVELPVPGVPLHEVHVAVGGYRTSAPVLMLVGGEDTKLLVGGVRASVNQQDIMRKGLSLKKNQKKQPSQCSTQCCYGQCSHAP